LIAGCCEYGNETSDYITGIEYINPLNAELNPICHLPALLGDAAIVVVSRLRVKRLRNC